jgi:hypothetical protein
MPFLPNDQNINRNGRKKGSLNKLTSNLRDTLETIQNENLAFILAHLSNLTLRERLQLNRDLLPFIVPKYTTINQIDKIDFNEMLKEYQLTETIKTLSTDELKQLLNEHE